MTATLHQVTKKKPTPRETVIGFGILGAIAVVLCCGGLAVIGAVTDDSDKGGVRTAAQAPATQRSATTPAETRRPNLGDPCPTPGQMTTTLDGQATTCNLYDDGVAKWGQPYERLFTPTPTAEPSPSKTTSKPTPRKTTAKPKPKKTTKKPTPSVRQGVHPGAFCSPGGARGRTSTGKLMVCKKSATDSRNRWRAA